ncbi:hypothetical protein T484DRAFT_1802811 [Baffinella frigidus]|nr:hypothetical protein T484DRAFT_1802811 [Cryptophyta sp. CCMP2293]
MAGERLHVTSSALASWRDHSRTSSRTRRVLARAAARLLIRALASALTRWGDKAQRGVAARGRMRGMVARWRRVGLARPFERWALGVRGEARGRAADGEVTRLRVALALSDGAATELSQTVQNCLAVEDALGAELGGAMKVVRSWRAPPAALPLRAWRAISDRAAMARRLLGRVEARDLTAAAMARGLLRRVEARGAGAALVAWGWVAKAQGRQRRVGRRVVARLQARSASMGFSRWRDASSILAQQRVVLLKVVARLQSALASLAFAQWSSITRRRLRVAGGARRAAWKQHLKALAAALERWHTRANTARAQRAMLREALRRMGRRGAGAAFGAWRAGVLEGARRRRVVARAGVLWRGRLLAGGLRRWGVFAHRHSERKRAMRGVLSRWRSAVLTNAFTAWESAASLLRLERTAGDKVAALSSEVGRLEGALAAANSTVLDLAATRAALVEREAGLVADLGGAMKVVGSWRALSLKRVFHAWGAKASAGAWQRLVARRVLERWKGRDTARGFAAWGGGVQAGGRKEAGAHGARTGV